MATPKSKRTPPSRIFENYTLTKIQDNCGLTLIPDSSMLLLSGGSDLTFGAGNHIGEGSSRDGISILTQIGFDFEFDETVYNNIVVSNAGWFALADPTAVSSLEVTDHVLANNLTGSIAESLNVNLSNSSNSVLLCPWFDDNRTVTGDINDISAGLVFGVEHGLEPPPIDYDEVAWGVKYYRDNSSNGRRLIIRWTVRPSFDSAGSVTQFDAVICENGNVEFRYPSRNKTRLLTTVNSTFEHATIGIFASGSNRFRDFAHDLKKIPLRENYIFGGAEYNESIVDSYSGSDRPYICSLKTGINWPSNNLNGVVYIFQPPKNLRRELPRKRSQLLNSRDKSRTSLFNDQRTINFLTTSSLEVVSYPSRLPRFFGGLDSSVHSRQNIFVGDILVTASVSSIASEQFLNEINNTQIKSFAFNESARPDQSGNASDDPFYMSGTLNSLSQPTRSKAQIHFSLPVNIKTKMFETSSSIYYYNKINKRWNIPLSTIDSGGDVADPASFTIDNPGLTTAAHFHDHRGFDPIGNFETSGSIPLTDGMQSHSFTLGGDFSIEHIRKLLSSDDGKYLSDGTEFQTSFNKTITVNDDYRAKSCELLEIPIDKPFLVEKAVFEIPIECGQGWFDDKTTSFPTLQSNEPYPNHWGLVDFGGPGLTISLFNQITKGGSSHRDLIMTGTVTHEYDNVSTLVMSNFPTFSDTYVLRPEGFLAYGQQPSVVINSQHDNIDLFTGSVVIPSVATVSNGITISYNRSLWLESLTMDGPLNRKSLLNLFKIQQLKLKTGDILTGYRFESFVVKFNNTLGRGDNEIFNPSGRSIFGNELATFQNSQLKNNFLIENSFYLPTGSIIGTQIGDAVDDGNQFNAVFHKPLVSHFTSPYLLNPKDKLILAISKTKPFFYNITGGSDNYFSRSLGHDIKLSTGEINVTLYGSYLQEGTEITSNAKIQTISSDAINEVIGSELITDQYEVSYRGELSGSYKSKYMTGSLLTKISLLDQAIQFVTGSRSRVFDKTNVRELNNPETVSQIFNLQPWWERSNNPRVNQALNFRERYWDSMMPNISDILGINGAGIFSITSGSTIIGTSNTLITDLNLKVGLIAFDMGPQGTDGIVDRIWSRSFPYESRYKNIVRQRNVSDSLKTALHTTLISGPGTVSNIPPKLVNSLYILQGAMPTNAYNNYLERVAGINGVAQIQYVTDINPYQSAIIPNYITGSIPANSNEFAKYIYGFGDVNHYGKGNSIHRGTNHAPDFRNLSPSSDPILFPQYFYGQSIIIRGWKYGVKNGLPEYSKVYYRIGNYGQFRDMLEQRLYTTYHVDNQLQSNVVTAKFVDSAGNITDPENTQLSNLSHASTSSCPYFDGNTRNRPEIIQETLNTNILTVKTDNFGNTIL